ncbi:transposase [Chryseobacterium sp. G0186]|uniref:helix-turn-helix domain-containing protein n=1 Tax=Chryseobacterium sp. G0186 TaxID=2487064 RepID=UPI000F4E13B9|nr:helix-turn-helix domain-containing protein [Chryseobacterium sp. G0186]AZA78972.1 transposase [Chryseobacterium sp. G0186]
MNFDIENIHVGRSIQERVTELNISRTRICNFMSSTDDEISKMYERESLDSEILLKWSKLLEYDFFRIYTQHLFVSGVQNRASASISKIQESSLPQFRKMIYDKEVIEFILELIDAGKKTKAEIMKEYRIPKATLYQWIRRYKKIEC